MSKVFNDSLKKKIAIVSIVSLLCSVVFFVFPHIQIKPRNMGSKDSTTQSSLVSQQL